jgi:hypothetical protein
MSALTGTSESAHLGGCGCGNRDDGAERSDGASDGQDARADRCCRGGSHVRGYHASSVQASSSVKGGSSHLLLTRGRMGSGKVEESGDEGGDSGMPLSRLAVRAKGAPTRKGSTRARPGKGAKPMGRDGTGRASAIASVGASWRPRQSVREGRDVATFAPSCLARFPGVSDLWHSYSNTCATRRRQTTSPAAPSCSEGFAVKVANELTSALCRPL